MDKMKLLEALLPVLLATILPLLFSGIRRTVSNAFKTVWKSFRRRYVTKGDIVAICNGHAIALQQQNATISAAMSLLRTVVHEVLPNNGGSMRDDMVRQFMVLLSLFSSRDEGQFITDKNGLVTWANETFCQRTGKSITELEGKGLLSIVVERDQDRFRRSFNDSITDKYEFRGVFAVRSIERNQVIHVPTEWRMVPVRDARNDEVIAWNGRVREMSSSSQRHMHPNPGALPPSSSSFDPHVLAIGPQDED